MVEETPNHMTRAEFYAKLEIFIARLQKERNDHVAFDDAARMEREGHTAWHGLDAEAKKNGRPGYHMVGYDEGQRFVKVWDQRGTTLDESGGKGVSYFVEKDTGIIFGAKSWKIYNPNHEYGTLDTIDKYNWSGYYGIPIGGTYKDTLVPKANRR